MGIITLIKMDYLDYYDIGFAFLPEHTGKCYSFESARCILDALPEQLIMDKIFAITTEENSRSIKTIEKLTDGTLQQFTEFETDEKTIITGNIAQRYSKFHKKGIIARECL